MTAGADYDSDGVGCRALVTAVGALLLFAVAAVAIGLSLVLADDPSPTAETVGLALYAAGAPVSGVFAAAAGDLPLTLYLDVLVWILAGAGISKLAERGGGLPRPLFAVIGLALLFGFGISSLIELA
ncbi:MAG: hypothetical protein ACFCVC_04460 [Acidimicrobiia bacterium]